MIWQISNLGTEIILTSKYNSALSGMLRNRPSDPQISVVQCGQSMTGEKGSINQQIYKNEKLMICCRLPSIEISKCCTCSTIIFSSTNNIILLCCFCLAALFQDIGFLRNCQGNSANTSCNQETRFRQPLHLSKRAAMF